MIRYLIIGVPNGLHYSGEYDFLSKIKSKIGSPEFIIDGGANIGLFTILCKSNSPDAKIICFEPEINNYEILKSNVSNLCYCKCFNMGLWSKVTNLEVIDRHTGDWGF